MIRRDGPMSPLDRLLIGLIGAAAGVGMVAVVAYAGAILRWQIAVLDRLVALFS